MTLLRNARCKCEANTRWSSAPQVKGLGREEHVALTDVQQTEYRIGLAEVRAQGDLVSAWSDFHDNEVRYLPCKGRVPAPIFLSLLTFDRARRSAPVVQPPVP